MLLGPWELVSAEWFAHVHAVGPSAEVGQLHREFLSFFGAVGNLFETAPMEVDMEFSDDEDCEPEALPLVCMCACRCA